MDQLNNSVIRGVAAGGDVNMRETREGAGGTRGRAERFSPRPVTVVGRGRGP